MKHAIERPGVTLAKRVMVLDDDPDFAISQGELIRSQGYEVETVISVQAAYQALETFSPDVVMIDIRLGKVDGIDLLSEFIVHESSPTCIMMTGHASIESAVEALKAGAYDYLTKPISPNELFSTLNRCFERISLETEKAQALKKLDSRNRELEYANRRLQRVVECMGELSGCGSVADLCHGLLEKVARSMGAEGGSVYLREDDRLVLAHSLDPGHAPAVIPMPINANSVLGRIMEKAEAVLISDAASSDGLMLSGWSGYRDESLLALPLTGENNKIIGILSLHTKQQPPFTPQDRDVGRILLAASSETLRAVKALDDLQQSQSLLQMIIDSVPECVKVLDRDGNVLQMNKAGLDMLGAGNFDQVHGACIYQFINPEYREAVQKMNEQALKEGASGRMVFTFRGLKGNDLWVDTHISPLRNADQEIIGVLDVTRDITEDRRLQEKSRQQELALIATNKMSALGTLVAGVAHEINNPNQTIQINSGLLGKVWEDAQKIMDEHVGTHGPIMLGGLQYTGAQGAHSELINDIRVGAEQIKTVVDRLRTFARPYDGIHGSIKDSPIQLNDAVQPAIALLRHAIRKGTEHFYLNLQESLPAIRGNRQQIQQVVINLMMNALEALPDRSCAIRLDTWLNTGKSTVELRLRDEGCGIEPDDLKQIMEPFYTTKRDKGGTGLGLSITHSLLKDLGATIDFDSEPGEGTRVVVSFPVVKH
jgi:PAS domain S-box-containing protein